MTQVSPVVAAVVTGDDDLPINGQEFLSSDTEQEQYQCQDWDSHSSIMKQVQDENRNNSQIVFKVFNFVKITSGISMNISCLFIKRREAHN